MKLQFKKQTYQDNAVKSILSVLDGQPKIESHKYRRDVSKEEVEKNEDLTVFNIEKHKKLKDKNNLYLGYKNANIALTERELIKNINEVQTENNIPLEKTLIKDYGKFSLDIEMETGTGKTFVYIKTIYELNKQKGFNKFIIVVPSIAIREGVHKSFEFMEQYFMEKYKKKARYFIYNSNNLSELDNFSKSANIEVMIINVQAFNKRTQSAKAGLKIFRKDNELFGDRVPIDVISANNPILILDEPQKMGGAKTIEAIKQFNPLFVLNFSATHKRNNNTVYALDSVDAFNQTLVKKIGVKGFEVQNLTGTSGYLYLEEIIISPTKPPKAKIRFEKKLKNGKIKRESLKLEQTDNLYDKSNKLEQYKDDYVISDILPYENLVRFTNGVELKRGVVIGDNTEETIRRVQIRETIKSHITKESVLFKNDIKTLSLFFIDEVSKYRKYDNDGVEINSLYGEIFEEEYENVVTEMIEDSKKAKNDDKDNETLILDDDYIKYLNHISVANTHKGYFSIDKKTNKKIDSIVKKTNDYLSDDISAYDLILKDKLRLLSFKEQTRFIFSHSALREGWDNPNVFQICTLKQSDNIISKRQEVGRGLRICVNSKGERIDLDYLNDDKDKFHSINELTVIASESYDNFCQELQNSMLADLRDRPKQATEEFFADKAITISNEKHKISQQVAKKYHRFLIKNDYVDENDEVTEQFKNDLSKGELKLPEDIKEQETALIKLTQSLYDVDVIKEMLGDKTKPELKTLKTNNNTDKDEWKNLWNKINYKYSYTVDFDSDELIKNAVENINQNLTVKQITYSVSETKQKSELQADKLNENSMFGKVEKDSFTIDYTNENITYDLIGKIGKATTLTRKTVAEILTTIDNEKFELFKKNPEEFISKVSTLMLEKKAGVIVSKIMYNKLEERFDSEIFTLENKNFDGGHKVKKAIQDIVFVDGYAKDGNSKEKQLLDELEDNNEVVVYAKLPKSFYIPTPLGNYSPDWAIAFKEGTVKHMYFIAETKGTLESLQLRPIEKGKTDCARKLFNEISNTNVKYGIVTNYDELLGKVELLK